MLQENDLKQIAQRGIGVEQVEHQLSQFKSGFPFLKLEGPAAIGNGILAPTEEERKKYIETWKDYKQAGHYGREVCS